MTRVLAFSFSFLLLVHTDPVPAAEMEKWIHVVRSVANEGEGNQAAAEAWRVLAQTSPEQISDLLEGMNGAGILAQNWLRSAVETVAQRAKEKGEFPADGLEAFVREKRHDEAPRLLAYDLLVESAPTRAAAIRPDLLLDPAPELRTFAVADQITLGDRLKKEGDMDRAKEVYQIGLKAARDIEQIDELVGRLRSVEVEVDVPKLLGLLTSWHLVAPFTNVDRNGFDQVFPPEEKVDLTATYPGKGKEAAWVAFTSEDEYGMVDFNKPFDMLKEVTGYAYTEVEWPEEREAELRLGCKNAWKVWLNGELLFGRDEYHRGMKLDQYKLPVRLKKGVNQILVKCCQNEQTETWTSEWRFQMRLCDETGAPLKHNNPTLKTE